MTASESHLNAPSTKARERIAKGPREEESRERPVESAKPKTAATKKPGRPISPNPKSKRAEYQREKMRQLRIDHPEKYGPKRKRQGDG